MNLAVPGSVNFSSVRIRTSEETGRPLRWSSEPFEGVWLNGDQWLWAQPSEVSLAETWNWLQHLRPMGSQVAHSAVQRALFSLLHATQESGDSPTVLIWLCSALEALYDVPAETIGRTLRNRVFLLLGCPTNHKAAARQIARLYNLRSKFAHGSFEVVHPLANDLLDPSIQKIDDVIFPVFDLGYALVLSTLQHMIRNGWRALKFDETLLGERATSGSLNSAPSQGMEPTQ
jgi:Apea-like HEPN